MMIAEKQILDDKGSKAAGTYHKAIQNLSKCPTKFDHPRELTVIGHIGPKMVELLTRKWRIYCDENDIEMPDTPASELCYSLLCLSKLADWIRIKEEGSSCKSAGKARPDRSSYTRRRGGRGRSHCTLSQETTQSGRTKTICPSAKYWRLCYPPSSRSCNRGPD
jgi:hypothetical protein